MITRILLSLPLWLAYSAVALVLDAIGLVILLPLSLAHAWKWRPSMFRQFRGLSGGEFRTVWWGGWLTWLWGNEEDGVTGPLWWRQRTGAFLVGHHWKKALSAYRWSALRNPTNNLRFIPWVNPVIDPERIDYINRLGDAYQITLTWQGAFSGLLAVFKFRGAFWRFWWGWKLKPEDASGVPDSDMRKPRCGFAIQLKRIN